jgi:hypothetical protein
MAVPDVSVTRFNITSTPATDVFPDILAALTSVIKFIGTVFAESKAKPQPWHLGHGPLVLSIPSFTASPSSTSSTAALATPSNAAQLLPWLTGPGPVIPPDTMVDGSGNEEGKVGNLEDMQTIVDDLGPGAEEEVKQFFENLKKEK